MPSFCHIKDLKAKDDACPTPCLSTVIFRAGARGSLQLQTPPALPLPGRTAARASPTCRGFVPAARGRDSEGHRLALRPSSPPCQVRRACRAKSRAQREAPGHRALGWVGPWRNRQARVDGAALGGGCAGRARAGGGGHSAPAGNAGAEPCQSHGLETLGSLSAIKMNEEQDCLDKHQPKETLEAVRRLLLHTA